mgnify:FL=1
MLKVNSHDDIRRWWEVVDRTTGEVVSCDDWSYSEETGDVTIAPAIPFHDYTVRFSGLYHVGSGTYVQCRCQ